VKLWNSADYIGAEEGSRRLGEDTERERLGCSALELLGMVSFPQNANHDSQYLMNSIKTFAQCQLRGL
jgi:hypothetical protein